MPRGPSLQPLSLVISVKEKSDSPMGSKFGIQILLILIQTQARLVLTSFAVVQSLSHVWFFADPTDCSTPGFPVLQYLKEFAQTHVH